MANLNRKKLRNFCELYYLKFLGKKDTNLMKILSDALLRLSIKTKMESSSKKNSLNFLKDLERPKLSETKSLKYSSLFEVSISLRTNHASNLIMKEKIKND